MSNRPLSIFRENQGDTVQYRLTRSTFSFPITKNSFELSADTTGGQLSQILCEAWNALSHSFHGSKLKNAIHDAPFQVGVFAQCHIDGPGDQYISLDAVGCGNDSIIPDGMRLISSRPFLFKMAGDRDPALEKEEAILIVTNLASQILAKVHACHYSDQLLGDLSIYLQAHRLANLTRLYQVSKIYHELEGEYNTSSRFSGFTLWLSEQDEDRIRNQLNIFANYDMPSVSSAGDAFPNRTERSRKSFGIADKLVMDDLALDDILQDMTDVFALKMYGYGGRNRLQEPFSARQKYSPRTLMSEILGYDPAPLFQPQFSVDPIFQNKKMGGSAAPDGKAVEFHHVSNKNSITIKPKPNIGSDFLDDHFLDFIDECPTDQAIYEFARQSTHATTELIHQALFEAYPEITYENAIDYFDLFRKAQKNQLISFDTFDPLEPIDLLEAAKADQKEIKDEKWDRNEVPEEYVATITPRYGMFPG